MDYIRDFLSSEKDQDFKKSLESVIVDKNPADKFKEVKLGIVNSRGESSAEKKLKNRRLGKLQTIENKVDMSSLNADSIANLSLTGSSSGQNAKPSPTKKIQRGYGEINGKGSKDPDRASVLVGSDSKCMCRSSLKDYAITPDNGIYDKNKAYVIDNHVVCTGGESCLGLKPITGDDFKPHPICQKGEVIMSTPKPGDTVATSIFVMMALAGSYSGLSEEFRSDVATLALSLAKRFGAEIKRYFTESLSGRRGSGYMQFMAGYYKQLSDFNISGNRPEQVVLMYDPDDNSDTGAARQIQGIVSKLNEIMTDNLVPQGTSAPDPERSARRNETMKKYNASKRVYEMSDLVVPFLEGWLCKPNGKRTRFGILKQVYAIDKSAFEFSKGITQSDKDIADAVIQEYLGDMGKSTGSGYETHEHGSNSLDLTTFLAVIIAHCPSLLNKSTKGILNFLNFIGASMLAASTGKKGAQKVWENLALYKSLQQFNAKEYQEFITFLENNRAKYQGDMHFDPNIPVLGKPATHKAMQLLTKTGGVMFTSEFIADNYKGLGMLLQYKDKNPAASELIRTFFSGVTVFTPPMQSNNVSGFMLVSNKGAAKYGAIVAKYKA